MYRSLKLIGILTLILVVSAGVRIEAGDFPITIEDDLGREVTVEEMPERISSLAPGNTEILFSLGLEDKIVGVTQSCDYPEAALEQEKIGEITEPNIEKIVAQEPDIVFASAINPREVVDRLEELDITVVGFNPETVHETTITIRKMGQLTGEIGEMEKLIGDLHVRMGRIQDIVDDYLENNERKKVFYELWTEPLMTAGEGTFIDDLIELAGGINIGAQAPGNWPQYSMETLILEDPEVYISTPHSAQEEVTVESIENRVEFESIKAIQEGNIYIVDPDIVNRPSPRLVKGLEEFVQAIHPELSSEIKEVD